MTKQTPERRRSGAGGKRPTSEETEARQRAIGERLRRLFDPVVEEPVPEEFLKLLGQADGSATRGDGDET